MLLLSSTRSFVVSRVFHARPTVRPAGSLNNWRTVNCAESLFPVCSKLGLSLLASRFFRRLPISLSTSVVGVCGCLHAGVVECNHMLCVSFQLYQAGVGQLVGIGQPLRSVSRGRWKVSDLCFSLSRVRCVVPVGGSFRIVRSVGFALFFF